MDTERWVGGLAVAGYRVSGRLDIVRRPDLPTQWHPLMLTLPPIGPRAATRTGVSHPGTTQMSAHVLSKLLQDNKQLNCGNAALEQHDYGRRPHFMNSSDLNQSNYSCAHLPGCKPLYEHPDQDTGPECPPLCFFFFHQRIPCQKFTDALNSNVVYSLCTGERQGQLIQGQKKMWEREERKWMDSHEQKTSRKPSKEIKRVFKDIPLSRGTPSVPRQCRGRRSTQMWDYHFISCRLLRASAL